MADNIILSCRHFNYCLKTNFKETQTQTPTDPDAHVEEMHDVTTKENYQNVCICTDISVLGWMDTTIKA